MTVRSSLPFAFLLSCAAFGHDSPNDVIDVLTHRLEAEGPSARMLVTRAFEYQALRQFTSALDDFESALQQQPDYAPALLGAGEVSLQLDRLEQGAAFARRGLQASADPRREAPCFALLARIESRRGNWAAALSAWRAALRAPQAEIEWLLGEADCLARLGRFREQCDALAVAMERNPSVVLRRAWIHALVDAGELKTAAREVERELAGARWRSSWWLLRARIAEIRQQPDRQRADAQAALAELQTRLNPRRPDPRLVAEFRLARHLSGLDESAAGPQAIGETPGPAR